MTVPEDDWIDALAGRTDATGPVAREGRALRKQILAQRQVTESTRPDAAREASLLDRARADGLLAAPSSGGSRGVARWRRLGTFAAAAVVILGIAVTLTSRSPIPPETVRGVERGTVQLEAQDPQSLKRQLIVELTAAGLKVSGYEKLASVGIDADLPQPVPPAVLRVLEQHHIPVPADGILVVEITAAPKQ